MNNMKNLSVNAILCVCVCWLLSACTQFSALKVVHPECEMLVNPLAIDNTNPHFSWMIESGNEGDTQAAYQILMASSESLLNEEDADIWNSGKVSSSESVWIPYGGTPLEAKSFVYWKVRVWNERGDVSSWSENACFGVGLLSGEDWKAQYIGLPGNETQEPLFWKNFSWNKDGEKALLHVNSLGYHEVYVNGEAVSDAVLSPAVSQFNKRSLSVTYDITRFLKKGGNDLVIWAGRGWYREGLPGVVKGGPYVRAQLEVQKDGGWNTFLVTDDSWSVRRSAYESFGSWWPHQFGGEILDAGKMLALDAASLKNAEWETAACAVIPAHETSPQMTEVNKIQNEMHPVSSSAAGDSAWIFDMGKNFTGWTEIKFPQLQKGQKVRISYCDFLDENKQFRDGQYEDYYIASGNGEEIFRNKFNYHAYRYMKLSGLAQAPELSDVSAYLIRTDYSGESHFSCSDEDMNLIHDMVHYTLQCLTLGGDMVDCPQIERLGYGGDGNASTPTVQTMYNLAPMYQNWMRAWADCMRPDGSMPHTAPNPYAAGGGPFWCGFLITASWQTYLNYGDPRLFESYYPYMKKWLEYAESYMKDGLLKQWPDTDYRQWYLGDWATPVGIDQTNPLSVDIVNNCYLVVCYQTIAKIAAILGNNEDKQAFSDKAATLQGKIHNTFFDENKKTYASGTQIDLVYPMLAGVTPKEFLADVQQTLFTETAGRFKGHLATGLVGIPVITEWCIENRQADFMYHMLKQRDYPGYLYMLDNGATTTWEHWDGNRSHIHNCYNGIGAWFYQGLAGILPDETEPGYKHVFIVPQPVDGISWVEASKSTPYGTLSVRWEKTDAFVMDVVVPVGCRASVVLPVEGNEVSCNEKSLDKAQSLSLTAGKHHIVSKSESK